MVARHRLLRKWEESGCVVFLKTFQVNAWEPGLSRFGGRLFWRWGEGG